MWLALNGSFKTGSTWLVQIAKSLPEIEPVPDHVRNPNWHNVSVKNASIASMLDIAQSNPSKMYFSKRHWPSAKILGDSPLDNVVVAIMLRDIRSVVSSAFFTISA